MHISTSAGAVCIRSANSSLLVICFLREAPERAIGSDQRAGKWGLAAEEIDDGFVSVGESLNVFPQVGDCRRCPLYRCSEERFHAAAITGFGLGRCRPYPKAWHPDYGLLTDKDDQIILRLNDTGDRAKSQKCCSRAGQLHST